MPQLLVPFTPRYQLLAPLGAGSMGIVYRATDRLSGQQVALKRVALEVDDADELRLALAHEFRTLAGLRHPHIISVLDYGFDTQHQPFFTMELLAGAQPILAASANLSLLARVDLLLQALETLAYLHRRSVLHHDLKPDNILVATGRARLLDFGLAVLASQHRSDDAFGTLLYLAPEVLDGQPYTEQADLYSLGIIAYTILVGAHPFPAETVSDFLDLTFSQPPDLNALAEHPALAAVVALLLAKHPDERPTSAQAAISALRAAVELPAQHVDTAIRESYLQAAAFVGREHELAQLTAALEAARQGQGSAWLIGGESGVGKSRLLDELRTQALVGGCLVLRGQAVEGGGLPYQLWRVPARRLVLATALSDLEASVLKALVPDIATLLERAVAAAPELAGEAGQQRLALTLVDLFKRQRQPVVLILEDLQWSAESLLPLKQLNRSVGELPLLILANYRNDERPDLPEVVPGMRVLPLQRLTEREVEAIGRAMLGASGTQAGVVRLLQQETEGNVFFVVEVVRALAEESGGLAQIGAMTLPAHVFAGGIVRILQRRLNMVPAWGQPLLRLAAVAGRQLDLAVLAQATRQTPALLAAHTLDAWLAACADAAVLTVADERWQFAHDKLREQLVRDHDQPPLHRQVAAAIEAVYPGDDRYAETLTTHWEAAGEAAQALPYLLTAVARMVQITGEYGRVARWIERGLAHATGPQRARLLILQGKAAELQSAYDEALTAYQAGLSASANDPPLQAEALHGLSMTLRYQARYPEARAYAAQALELAQRVDDQRGIAMSLTNLGIMADIESEYRAARTHMEHAIAIYRTFGDRADMAMGLFILGNMASSTPAHLSEAEGYLRESLEIMREIGNRAGVARASMSLGITKDILEDYHAALTAYAASLAIFRELGQLQGIGDCLYNMAISFHSLGDVHTAQTHLQECLGLFQQIGDRFGVALSHGLLGAVAYALGDDHTARHQYEQALAAYREIDLINYTVEIQGYLVIVLVRLGEQESARMLLREAVQASLALESELAQGSALLAAAFWLHANGKAEQSVSCYSVAARLSHNISPIGAFYTEDLAATLRQTLAIDRWEALVAQATNLEAAVTLRQVLAELPSTPGAP